MLPKEVLDSAPHTPGVYIMLDKASAVLYVGKAKDLFRRLASYVHHSRADWNKTAVMLQKVQSVKTILTKTEKEALLLEASLIKKHKPRYNIILRDDKSYPYIKLTLQEEWPRVFMARRKAKDGARYFGPYSSPNAMWATLRLIASLFPLRTCKGSVVKPRSRPCLNRQIGRCLAPCIGKVNREVYMAHVDQVLMLLEGRSRKLIDTLTAEMEQAASRLDFERAAILRDQIAALSRTLEKQVIFAKHGKDQDVFGFARKNAAVAVVVLCIREGLINGSRNFFLADPYGEDDAILSQVVGQLYSGDTVLPGEILLPFALPDQELHEENLSDSAGHRVYVKTPQRGDSAGLISMANNNAAQIFEEKEKRKSSWENLCRSMEKNLHLQRAPNRVECLDISNISGRQAVGSLVCFMEGEADKKNFRHYRIRTVEGPNDYAMMKEVLERRLSRGREEGNLPDLFVVDGGKGQLGIALAVARELGVYEEVDWIGIAKERQDEGEKLFRPGRKNPILLPAHNPVLLYLMRIRDESHRYGVTFHRKLRNKETLTSELDAIPGIGTAKKKLLLKQLGSLKRVKEANLDELMAVPGIGSQLATQIHQHFQDDGKNAD